MKKMIAIAVTAASLATLAPASAQDNWGGPRQGERGPRPGDFGPGPGPGDRMAPLAGPGVRLLIPELREDPRGRVFVMRHFDWNHDGLIEPREAIAANHAFIGGGRGGPGWGGPDQAPMPMGRPGGWDRGALHGYGFRQTPRGAMFRLDEDVLFATDSDVLRPMAIEKLRPLAAYLSANPGVRVAIDGFTDSRGSDAHNQDLSERRAASVRNALAGMGADRARFSVTGHGERDPIATNATPQGMRQNRRVEVTLLGRRATEF